jgi:hypothetical protein
MPLDRRSFVSALGVGVAGATILPAALAAAERREIAAPTWDLDWLDQFKGKHRQVFDLDGRNATENGNPLRVVKNWLNAHRDVYALAGDDLNTCIGITSECFPMNARDELWTRYPIGQHWKVTDPDTGKPAMRNIWLDNAPGGAESSIHALQARGSIFWQCNNALNGVVRELVAVTGGKAEDIRADLVAGLVPGVRLVAAHTMLVGLVQERRFTYQKL